VGNGRATKSCVGSDYNIDLDLGRKVVAGVAFLEHGDRRHLRVPQVRAGVGVVDAVREPFGVVGELFEVIGESFHISDESFGMTIRRPDSGDCETQWLC